MLLCLNQLLQLLGLLHIPSLLNVVISTSLIDSLVMDFHF
jgi:hypothetical protein